MNSIQKLERFRRHAEESMLLRRVIVERLGEQIIECSNLIAGVIGSGGKILLAGNGESAATASHFAAQLVVRLRADHLRQSLPAITLAGDTAVLTAAATELGFKEMFARQIEGIGHKGDLLIVISTSDDAESLTRAIQVARARGMLTIVLLGDDSVLLANSVDSVMLIPDPSIHRVQVEHLFLSHLLVELIETDLVA